MLLAAVRQEQTLLAVIQQRNTFIAAAAHDMKNQITVIQTVAQLLERQTRGEKAAEPAAFMSGLAMIQGGTRKLQRLVDEFMDLSRLTSGQPVEFNEQSTDLVAVARACVHEFADAGDHELILSTAADTMMGMWDASRVERVIANLLSNATKYSAPASPILVTLDLDRDGGDVAVLAVRDQGVGIPAADLPHMFTPFYRGSNVAKTTFGTGIGLFGARAIIEQQGGTLHLESTDGVGTTATIRLPLDPVSASNPSVSAHLTSSGPTS